MAKKDFNKDSLKSLEYLDLQKYLVLYFNLALTLRLASSKRNCGLILSSNIAN